VTLIEHSSNTGKSRAVADGIQASSGEYIFLLDADLKHLHEKNITDLILPIENGTAQVTLSYRKNAWPLFPFKEIDYLTGERIIPKKNLIPFLTSMGSISSYGLEVFINRIIIKDRLTLSVVRWSNVENDFNHTKHGWWKGVKIIVKIWWNVVGTVGVIEMYSQNIEMRKLLVHITNMKLSFVIPAFNEEKILGKCLESIRLELSTGSYDTEIIVVNNNSTDKTKEVALSFPRVKVVDEMQKGIVFARKVGFMASSGEIVANIDADTMLTKGWVATVMKEFDSDTHLVALSGPYIYYDLSPFVRGCVKVFYFFGYVFYFINHFLFNKGAMLQGGNFIVKRKALIDAGGFDTSIEFYGEDTDIARRISRYGKVLWTFRLPMYTSGRRLLEEGVIMTGIRYATNFLWVSFFGKPFTKEYSDIRLEK
jgi:glycosyltransferase involved in cell wall biosynthesis